VLIALHDATKSITQSICNSTFEKSEIQIVEAKPINWISDWCNNKLRLATIVHK